MIFLILLISLGNPICIKHLASCSVGNHFYVCWHMLNLSRNIDAITHWELIMPKHDHCRRPHPRQRSSQIYCHLFRNTFLTIKHHIHINNIFDEMPTWTQQIKFILHLSANFTAFAPTLSVRNWITTMMPWHNNSQAKSIVWCLDNFIVRMMHKFYLDSLQQKMRLMEIMTFSR